MKLSTDNVVKRYLNVSRTEKEMSCKNSNSSSDTVWPPWWERVCSISEESVNDHRVDVGGVNLQNFNGQSANIKRANDRRVDMGGGVNVQNFNGQSANIKNANDQSVNEKRVAIGNQHVKQRVRDELQKQQQRQRRLTHQQV